MVIRNLPADRTPGFLKLDTVSCILKPVVEDIVVLNSPPINSVLPLKLNVRVPLGGRQ